MKIKRKDTYTVIHDNGDEETVSRFCHHCLEYGFENRLGPKILTRGQKPAPDHDKWSQCIECGYIYPIHQTIQNEVIKDSIETITNPFDYGHTITGLGNKKSKNRREKDREKLLDRIDNEKEDDIKQALRRGNTVEIFEESVD